MVTRFLGSGVDGRDLFVLCWELSDLSCDVSDIDLELSDLGWDVSDLGWEGFEKSAEERRSWICLTAKELAFV